MARMNTSARIELGLKMIARWTSKGCISDRTVTFVTDMVARLQSGRGMSTKQRAWFDKAVLMDPPEPKNKELVTSLRAAANLAGMEKVKEPLNDFAYKLSKGWNLSEKQVGFMNKLMAQAKEIRENGPWAPTDEERKQVEIGVAFTRRYSDYYLSSCPGIAAARNECKDWLDGNVPHLDKWSAGKMMKLCKGDRQKLVDGIERWPSGSLVELKSGSQIDRKTAPFLTDGTPLPGQVGLVISEPLITADGMPGLSILLNGVPCDIKLGDLVKKRKKRVKKS